MLSACCAAKQVRFVAAEQKIAEPSPQIKTVRVEGEWKGRFRTDLNVRDFHFIIAEPEKIGGKNEGPTPMEYVLGALNGCLNVVIELVAKERGFGLRDSYMCHHDAHHPRSPSTVACENAISARLTTEYRPDHDVI